ncbi:hypothetical protein V8G54_034596 [Vigna mungo]|uniref:Uncharacterized protein n=1 Tax=Vigna mungo TaxID=3915 RepID=A0AAQ3RHF8_VIGMU
MRISTQHFQTSEEILAITASTLAQHSKPQKMLSPMLCFNAETISPKMIVFLASTTPQPKSATAPKPTAPESSTTAASSGDSSRKWIIIAASVGAVVALLCVLFAWRWFIKPKRVPRGE